MNPFTPGFGTTPRVLVDRQQIVDLLARAFLPGFDPHRATWLKAPRGTGKTVLLNEAQDRAQQAGWIVVQEDAQSAGLGDRIVEQLLALRQPTPSRRLKSASGQILGTGGGIEFTETTTPSRPSLRRLLEETVQQPDNNGVLITVDEVHAGDRTDIAELGNAVQHLIRQDLPVAILLAGLPQPDDDTIATFLSRCSQPDLQRLDRDAVRDGLHRTANTERGTFTATALDLAADAVAGYPYMLQLVGYWAWEHATGNGATPVTIDDADVQAAVPSAARALERSGIMKTTRPITDIERAFLSSMADDDGPSAIRAIAERVGLNANAINQHRRRLIEIGLVIPAGHGYIDFAVPGMRSIVRTGALRPRDQQ